MRAWTACEPGLAVANAANAAAARGILQGVPVGVKDTLDTFDLPTQYGSPIYAGHRPRADAAVVALTRRAGGAILGKTATTEFATHVPTVTRNPHDTSRTPGGSSSGSAAAVADGMVPLAFGTQTAGSVIRPAAYCGVVGYKPTYDLLPRAGVKPHADSLDTVGLFARSVDDAAFFISALSGLAPQTVERPRIAWCRTYEWPSAQPETQALFERLATRLSLKEVSLPPAFKGLRAAQATIQRYELARSIADEYFRFKDQLDASLRERCELGYAIEVPQYAAALQLATRCRAMLDEAFGDCDALLVPAAVGEAPMGLASTGDAVMNAMWTLLQGPSVCVPAGHGPNRMPLAVQVVGRIGEDARTLACAEWLENKIGSDPI